MDTFYSTSSAPAYGRWGHDSLKHLCEISPAIQSHLKLVYLTLCLARGDGEELWSADLSKLEIRRKFASGRHSRVYSGRYYGREVSIKMVSQPEKDAALAAELEQ